MPNPVAKRVCCLDWQPFLGPFTWKEYFPKDARVLCKATADPNTLLSIIHYLLNKNFSHDYILKMYNLRNPLPQKPHSPILAFPHPTSVSTTHKLIYLTSSSSSSRTLVCRPHTCSHRITLLPAFLSSLSSLDHMCHHFWPDYETI